MRGRKHRNGIFVSGIGGTLADKGIVAVAVLVRVIAM
jgi:hypothetical protein